MTVASLTNINIDSYKAKLLLFHGTVKLGFKERLDKEQIGNSEPFPITNLLVYLINSEQIGISDQFFDDQKVPYYYNLYLWRSHQVWGFWTVSVEMAECAPWEHTFLTDNDGVSDTVIALNLRSAQKYN